MRRVVVVSVTTVVLLIVLAGSVSLYIYYQATWGMERRMRDRQEMLANMTNGDQVLAGCREILKRAKSYRADPSWHGASAGEYPDPTDPTIPAAIRQLKPGYISVVGGQTVTLEYGGGFNHFGVRAYAPGIAGEGTKQIAPGLLYYAERDFRRDAASTQP